MIRFWGLVAVTILGAGTLVCCGPRVATSGTDSIYALAEKGDSVEVSKALKNGFDVNQPDDKGMTLLHHAAIGNQRDLAELLIENYRANVKIKDKDGYTPFDYTEPGSPAANVFQEER